MNNIERTKKQNYMIRETGVKGLARWIQGKYVINWKISYHKKITLKIIKTMYNKLKNNHPEPHGD